MKQHKLVLKKIITIQLNQLPITIVDLQSLQFDFTEKNTFYAVGHSNEDIQCDSEFQEEIDTLKKPPKKSVKVEKFTITPDELLSSTIAYLKFKNEDQDDQVKSYNFSQSFDLLAITTNL